MMNLKTDYVNKIYLQHFWFLRKALTICYGIKHPSTFESYHAVKLVLNGLREVKP
jgi:hypothetical protein